MDNPVPKSRIQDAGTAYTDELTEVSRTEYRNICAGYLLRTLKSKWNTPQKVVENHKANILWDLGI